MEECNRLDLQRNVERQPSMWPSSVLKSTSRSTTPRGSPSFRRWNSGRTPRRGGRTGGFSTNCFRSNRIVLWLLLITLWAYAGFYIQSRWAHGDNKEGIFGGSDESSSSEEIHRRDLSASNDSLIVKIGINGNQSDEKKIDAVLAKNGNANVLRSSVALKKRSKRSRRSSRKNRGNQKKTLETEGSTVTPPSRSGKGGHASNKT